MSRHRFLAILVIGMVILIPAALLATRLDLKPGNLKVKQAAGKQATKNAAEPKASSTAKAAGKENDKRSAEGSEETASKTGERPTLSGEKGAPAEQAPPKQAGPQQNAAEQPEAHSGIVYLTFDDGPNTITTPQILDILKSHGVKATFFVTGHNARLNPGVLRHILEEGHAIGNHSYDHDYTMYRDVAAFASDLDRAEEAIQAATGTRPILYRPPGGTNNLTPACKKTLAERGYRIVGWNVTSADTDPHGVTPEQLISNVLNGVAKVSRKGLAAIVLMHDGTQTGGKPTPGTPGYIYIKNREADVAALPVIIRRLQEDGYTLLPLPNK